MEKVIAHKPHLPDQVGKAGFEAPDWLKLSPGQALKRSNDADDANRFGAEPAEPVEPIANSETSIASTMTTSPSLCVVLCRLCAVVVGRVDALS